MIMERGARRLTSPGAARAAACAIGLMGCGKDAVLGEPTPDPAPEICNFEDDNGDGQVDEGFDWIASPWSLLYDTRWAAAADDALVLDDGRLAFAGRDSCGIAADRGVVLVTSSQDPFAPVAADPSFALGDVGATAALAQGPAGEVAALFTAASSASVLRRYGPDATLLESNALNDLAHKAPNNPAGLVWTGARYAAWTCADAGENVCAAHLTWLGDDPIDLPFAEARGIAACAGGVAWLSAPWDGAGQVEVGILSADGPDEEVAAVTVAEVDDHVGIVSPGHPIACQGDQVFVMYTTADPGPWIARWSPGAGVVGPVKLDDSDLRLISILPLEAGAAVAATNEEADAASVFRVRADLQPVSTPSAPLRVSGGGRVGASILRDRDLLLLRGVYGSYHPNTCTNDGAQLETARVGCPWSVSFGGDEPADGQQHIAADPRGNVLLTGSFSSTIDLGAGEVSPAGPADIYVAKLDTMGAPLWSKTFGGATALGAKSVAADGAGNVIVTGTFESGMDFGGGALSAESSAGSPAFLLELGPDGEHRWSKGLSYTFGLAVAAGQSGDVWLAGAYNDSTTFGCGAIAPAGSGDSFVARFDAGGDCAMSKGFATGQNEAFLDIALGGASEATVVGYQRSTIDYGCGGTTYAGGEDAVVVRLAPDGSCVWSRAYGDGSNQRATHAAAACAPGVPCSDDVAIAGYHVGVIDLGDGIVLSSREEGVSDVFVAKLDGAGQTSWARSFGSGSDDQVAGVAMGPDGAVFLAMTASGPVDLGDGATVGSPDAGTDAVVIKLAAADGEVVWARAFGDEDTQGASGVTVDGAGGVILRGLFEGAMDLGTGALVSKGGQALYLAKLPR
jgi:hypothetical protein